MRDFHKKYNSLRTEIEKRWDNERLNKGIRHLSEVEKDLKYLGEIREMKRPDRTYCYLYGRKYTIIRADDHRIK